MLDFKLIKIMFEVSWVCLKMFEMKGWRSLLQMLLVLFLYLVRSLILGVMVWLYIWFRMKVMSFCGIFCMFFRFLVIIFLCWRVNRFLLYFLSVFLKFLLLFRFLQCFNWWQMLEFWFRNGWVFFLERQMDVMWWIMVRMF